MDPPYNKQLENKVLEFLKDSCILDNDTLIIVEASLETDFSFTLNLGYEIKKEKIYKTNKHIFLKTAKVRQEQFILEVLTRSH